MSRRGRALRARLGRICILALVLSPTWVRADLVDDERTAQWEQWREEPLDLSSATTEEVELLPGSDARLAHALISLRELRGLPDDLATLRAQLGAGAELEEQWRDLVVIGGGASRRSLRLQTDARMAAFAEGTDAPELRTQVVQRAGPLLLAHGARSASEQAGRTWIALELDTVTLVAGHLRVRSGDGLLFADAGVRSRTGASRAPRRPQLEGRSGTLVGGAPTGLGVQWTRSRQQLWVAALRDAAGQESVAGAADFESAEMRGGIAWQVDPQGMRPSVWTSRGGMHGSAWWAAIAGARSGSVTHAGVRWAGPSWKVGAAFTRADTPGQAGVDPLTGSALDRTHRGWQLDAARRERTWSIEVLARNLTRGRPGALATKERGRVRWEWRPPRSSPAAARWWLALETGLDEELTEPWGEGELATNSQRLRVEREGERADAMGRIVAVWRRAGRVGARQEALAVRLGFARPLAWSLGAAVATGQRSSPWSVQQPGYGSTPLWIEPAGVAASLGARLGSFGGIDGGAWLWWREGPERGAEFGGGFALRLRSGGNGAIVAR